MRARRDRALRVAVATVVALALGAGSASSAAADERIVALTPFTANTLAQLGIVPVGIGQTLGGRDRLAPALRGVRQLPLSHPNGPNLEQLAALNAQLVFSSPTWQRGHAGMRRLGMRVVESEPRSVSAMITATRNIGRIVGREAQARQRAAAAQRRIAAATRGIPRKKPRVLLLLGVGRTPYAFLENSWGGDVLRRAGARLLTGGLKANGGLARISNETVVKRNPDIIIAVPHATPENVPALARYLRTNPAWRRTSAARNKRVYVSQDNSLLQAGTDVERTIRQVRTRYLRNG
ncbi:MAG: ABC transporter substrate-binding protein [Solirubrobacteraceae bacterium]|nr:ABC transporter substrate-binding protein [Solirubrobacteraceae bacterium]